MFARQPQYNPTMTSNGIVLKLAVCTLLLLSTISPVYGETKRNTDGDSDYDSDYDSDNDTGPPGSSSVCINGDCITLGCASGTATSMIPAGCTLSQVNFGAENISKVLESCRCMCGDKTETCKKF